MYSDYDKELIRRGVIVPVFKAKPPKNNLNFIFKGKSYLEYSKARSKVRSLNLKNANEWKKYCYLHTNMPFGVPESPEIVYRNKGWKNFNDWLGISSNKRSKKKARKAKSRKKKIVIKSKPLDQIKNYKFSKLASKRLPKAKTAIKLIGNLSNTSSYKYTDDDVNKIFKSLSKAMKELRKKFKR
tara:strand:+ start:320 stop:871 length:552 start_codon:yes stop_codon:yes gene_type:complete